jgi:low affinity Fe/Cu permease
MAQNTAKLAGSSSAFLAICLITFVWLVTEPIFHWSDWQLVINTVTNIVSMLMVFIIQKIIQKLKTWKVPPSLGLCEVLTIPS